VVLGIRLWLPRASSSQPSGEFALAVCQQIADNLDAVSAGVMNGNARDVLDFVLPGHRLVNGHGRWNESAHIQPFAMGEISVITLMLKIKVLDNVLVVRDSNPWPYPVLYLPTLNLAL
jgi:hypothetical protein